MDKHRENFNREIKNVRKNQWELKNTIIEMKKYTRENQQQIDNKEEWISDLKDRVVEITQL